MLTFRNFAKSLIAAPNAKDSSTDILKCSMCSYSTQGKQQFDIHCARHLGHHKYSCDYCKKGFVTKNEAVVHMRVHTGCDSGFGHALAKRMDSYGYRVFAGCLNEKAEGAANLKQTCSSKLCVLPLDVTSEQSVLSAKDSIEKKLGSDVLWCVVNNAGVVQSGELDWTLTEEILSTHLVNTFGTVRVSKAFLALLKKSRGRLVNNASACGRFICPGFVGYCMSKCATIAFSEGLRVEMMKWGVKVISIEPFFYKTPLTQPEAADASIERTWKKADEQTRETYGVGYLENFKKSSRQLLSRASPNVHEVIDCFVDAIVSRDPLSTYFPAFLPDKIGIKVLQFMPKVLLEHYLRLQLEGGRGHFVY